MSELAERLESLRARIAAACAAADRDPAGVELMAVSKTFPVAAIREAQPSGRGTALPMELYC